MKQRGFTLIELMVIIAIVGILVSIAIPAYQDYLVRARITEGLQLASPAKLAIAETAQANNGLPATQEATGYTSPAATSNVESIAISDDGKAVITIKYTPAAKNLALTLSPTLSSHGDITWVCAVTDAANNKYVPYDCRR